MTASIAPLEELRWGWVTSRKGQLLPQLETFASVDDALKAMRQRQSSDCDWTVEEFAAYGFQLARVKVTIQAISVLTPLAK